MKKYTNAKYFIAGMLATTVLSSTVIPAFAQSIDATFNSIGIDLNGTEIKAGENYTLSNGSSVPYSTVYNNTTYLPLRKISDSLGLDVEWNQDTKIASISKSDSTSTNTNDSNNESDTSNDEYQKSDLTIALNINDKIYKITGSDSIGELFKVSATKDNEYYISAHGVLDLLYCYDGTKQYYNNDEVYSTYSNIKYTLDQNNTDFLNTLTIINNNNNQTYITNNETNGIKFNNNNLNCTIYENSTSINGKRCLPVNKVFNQLGIKYTLNIDNNLLIFSF